MSLEQAEMLIEQNAAILERLEELLTVVGNLQGYAIFAVTVILMIYSYKFLRMFF